MNGSHLNQVILPFVYSAQRLETELVYAAVTLANVLSLIVFDRLQCCVFIEETVLRNWIGVRIYSIVVLTKIMYEEIQQMFRIHDWHCRSKDRLHH